MSMRSRVSSISLKVKRSEEHTSELQSQSNLVCRLLLEKKKHKPFPLLIAIPRATLTVPLFPLGHAPIPLTSHSCALLPQADFPALSAGHHEGRPSSATS